MKIRKIVAGVVSASLAFGSSAATAASAPPPAPVSSSQASWLTLSMLTPGGAIGLGGAAVQLPPPDNTSPRQAYGPNPTPPVPVIAVWLATLAASVYILTREHHGQFFFRKPPSPT